MSGYVEMEFETWEEADRFSNVYDELLKASELYVNESRAYFNGEVEHSLAFWVVLREQVTRKAFELCGYDIEAIEKGV